jgi:hypothetical protein
LIYIPTRGFFDAIVAFTREELLPVFTMGHIAQFAANLYTRHDFYATNAPERVEKALLQAFGGQTFVLEHTGVVLITKKAGKVDCTAYAYGPPNSLPWGIPSPPCDKCKSAANLKISTTTEKNCIGNKSSRSAVKVAQYTCKGTCNRRTKVKRPSDVALWDVPHLNNFYKYPYPTIVEPKWRPLDIHTSGDDGTGEDVHET